MGIDDGPVAVKRIHWTKEVRMTQAKWSNPELIETIGMAFMPWPLPENWQPLLAKGGALAALVPTDNHRYTLIFRQPAHDGTPTESDSSFRARADRAKAIAIVTEDWRLVADEYARLVDIERMFHQAVIDLAALRSQLAEETEKATNSVDVMIAIMRGDSAVPRGAQLAVLLKILDRLESLAERMDNLEAQQQNPPHSSQGTA
jgi:hypothetical protein